ncbi:hypothetical protein JTB14_018675 [Gonioctena quinquepunctata]|nr:hypothetical protein JTB14_018675 [Gonioctena quinquepunctata]
MKADHKKGSAQTIARRVGRKRRKITLDQLKATIRRITQKVKNMCELAWDMPAHKELKDAVWEIEAISTKISEEVNNVEEIDSRKQEEDKSVNVTESDLAIFTALGQVLDVKWPELIYKATGKNALEGKYLKGVRERYPAIVSMADTIKTNDVECFMNETKIKTSRGEDTDNSRYIFLAPYDTDAKRVNDS